ncbi:MAG: hypothetical protein WAP51_04320 [Candidatus Sungiibacteriota bacterium]
MKRYAGFCLCVTLIFAGAFPALAAETNKEGLTLDPRIFEYFEYETIVLSMLSNPRDPSVPNWRELYLRKVERYEEFLAKYSDTPLRAEVKLRIAELYKDVDKEEVYPFRVELYRCLAGRSDENNGTLEKRKDCINKFYKDVGRWRDPAYVQKAVNLLLELVRDYGHTKRYNMEEPKIGGFKWVDEDIGAKVLYLLAKGTNPKNKEKMLLLILREYKAGPTLLFQINEDLEKLQGAKSK